MISKDNAYDTIAEYGSSCRKRQMKLSEKIIEVFGEVNSLGRTTAVVRLHNS